MTGRGAARLRIGIAGLGFGLDVHLPGFRGIPNVEVIGLLGRDPVRAAAVAATTGLPVSTDVTAWLDAPFDAVSLALPPAGLDEIAAAAMDRGLPILCEKPLGSDNASACALAARAAGRPSAVDFEFAELATFAALHEMIRAGAIGPIRHVAVAWLMESRAHRDGQWSWKTDAARHGGVVTLLGTHVFYLLEWLLGPIDRLSARLDCRATSRFIPADSERPADDLAHLLLEHRGGAVSSVVLGNANPAVAVHRWTIIGERGSAVLENAGNSLTGFTLNVCDRDGRVIHRSAEATTGEDSRIEPFRRLASRFVAAVRAGTRCRPDFDDGARVAALADAAKHSASVGTWVKADNPTMWH
jgi:predicted dehydrogenase